MHPHLQACLSVLEELYDDLVAALRQLDDLCINWTAPAPETNSIAALVRHVIGSNDVAGHGRDQPSEDADLSVAWWVVHALIHTGEHWGQVQINRQLYGANPGESAR